MNRILLGLLLSVSALRAEEVTLTVGVESSLREVMRELVTAWADENTKVELAVANARHLRTQMEKDTGWDLVITSDTEATILLTATKKLSPDSVVKVARDRLVVFARKPLTPDEDPEWFGLISDEWGHVAMPDPDQTVSGRAGQAALEKRKLWTLVKAKTQLTPNENASLDLIKRNQVEATIMGYSNVSNLKIPGWQVYDVDPADYPALNYQAVVAANSPRKNAAQAFQRFMTSAEAKPVWEKYGFWAPQ